MRTSIKDGVLTIYNEGRYTMCLVDVDEGGPVISAKTKKECKRVFDDALKLAKAVKFLIDYKEQL